MTARRISVEDIDNFVGHCQSNDEMAAAIEHMAPSCHFTKMLLLESDAPSTEKWWECNHCGHTKPYL